MNNKKGISMISLVIIIVVTIILVSIVTTAGYKYITETNRVEAEALVSVIAEAAYRRQNDLSAGVTSYYEGYSFSVTENKDKYKGITGIPTEDVLPENPAGTNGNGIPDCLEKDGASWFLFDAESAQALGVSDAEKFLTRNISYPDALTEKEIRLVLADYSTGDGYLVNIPKEFISDTLREVGGCPASPNGNHSFKILATCTESAKCVYCGADDPEHGPLGHDYTEATCTASAICRRCGEVDPEHPALGHDMITNDDILDAELVAEMEKRECRMYANTEDDTDSAWITNAEKHWHECKRCNERFSENTHRKETVSLPKDAGEDRDLYHYDQCLDCPWHSLETPHTFKYEIVDSTHHKKYCTVCDYGRTAGEEVIHDETPDEDSDLNGAWKATTDYHYRECEDEHKCTDGKLVVDGTEKDVLFVQPHEDKDGDHKCDVCGKNTDNTPPLPFGSSKYYAKITKITTNSISVEAYTFDEGVGVDYYEFGKRYVPNGGSAEVFEWLEPVKANLNADGSVSETPVTFTFENLKANTDYYLYVKATDRVGNVNAPYLIPGNGEDGNGGTGGGVELAKFPTIAGLSGIPDDYIRESVNLDILPVETDLPNIYVVYSTDGGKTWTEEGIPIADLYEANNPEIKLTEEKSYDVWLKLIDSQYLKDALNESPVVQYNGIDKLDKTPPTVTINTMPGDKADDAKLVHTAKVTITDERAGIKPETEVKYAWAPEGQRPSQDEFNKNVIKTGNVSTAREVSFTVNTPNKVDGEFVLWIDKGVSDRIGNRTTEQEKASFSFKVDSKEAVITNIQMRNREPAIKTEPFFVKTDGYVTITFTVDKELQRDPLVTLNGNRVTDISVSEENKLDYTCRIKITDIFEEGTLQLKITNVVSKAGVVSATVYENSNIVPGSGPVFYDKIFPLFEYISKKSNP